MKEVIKNVLSVDEIKKEILKVNLTDDMKGIKEHNVIKKLFEDNYNIIVGACQDGENIDFTKFANGFLPDNDPETCLKIDILNQLFSEVVESRTQLKQENGTEGDSKSQQPLTGGQNAEQQVGPQMQKTNRLEPANQATPTMLVMNGKDIVKDNNVRLAKLITNAKTESQIDRIRESEAQVLASLLMHANKNIDALKKDNENLKTLIEKSNRCLDKIDTKKQTQFKKTENAINSRTHLTGMKIEVIEPVIPDNIDLADLDAMMNDFEEDFDVGYESLEAANSNYDQLFSYYKNGLETLSSKK